MTFALVICLFFSEIVWYRTKRVENHLLVDTSQVGKMHHLRCQWPPEHALFLTR